MAEKTFTISQSTLMPIGLVVTLLGALLFNENRLQNQAAKIEQLTTTNLRLETDIKEIRATYVERREFDLRLENFSNKLDQVISLVKKK